MAPGVRGAWDLPARNRLAAIGVTTQGDPAIANAKDAGRTTAFPARLHVADDQHLRVAPIVPCRFVDPVASVGLFQTDGLECWPDRGSRLLRPGVRQEVRESRLEAPQVQAS